MNISRRGFLAGSLGVAGAAVLGGCSNDRRTSLPTTTSSARTGITGKPLTGELAAPGTPGLINEAAYQTRVNAYLASVTKKLDPSDATSIVAHLVAARRDPKFQWDSAAVTIDSLTPVWDKIDSWEDTRDFRLMYLHWVLFLADGSSPMTTIDPGVIAAIEQRMIDNRYRWNDPLPPDRTDNQWFWSENHVMIGLVNEYLAGIRMPQKKFKITGLSGTDHAKRSKQPMLDWINERSRFGFFEWHSHVYMNLNVAALLTLVDIADDPELIVAAGMALDLCTLDMAAFCHEGVYAASRGRTYAKDKLTVREPTFDVFKLLFDDTDLDHAGEGASIATYLAASRRYRAPQVLVDMATANNPGVVRERHGIFVDGTSNITANPQAPFGYDFNDAKNLSFWWSQGMLGTWQMTDTNLKAAKEFRLLESTALADVAALVALNGGDPDRVRTFVQKNHAILNFGHLREANTYAWRSDTVSLATVVDHRFGEMRDQIHTWQATIDAGAVVFTTHPRADLPVADTWQDDKKPGYWTGEASIPRSVQHERTGIHIYQPAWDATTDALLWGIFGYQDYTHAFVPQDRFEDVVRDGNWTFAHKGGGYIALWSWRQPSWRTYDPAINPTDGHTKPFDLVALGGADNVWIVEVGDASTADSFAAFMKVIKKSVPTVVRDTAGFKVAWRSPTSGDVAFGSTEPFMVNNKEQQLGEFPRHESRWGNVERLASKFNLRGDGATLGLDFDKWSRAVGTA